MDITDKKKGCPKSRIAPLLLFIFGKKVLSYRCQKTNIIAMAKIVFKELTSNQNVLFPVSLSER